MKQKTLTAYELISGMTSRKYRKRLATYSVRPDDSMLTLKFRLDHADELQRRIPFNRFRLLYDVVENIQEGSLIHYLFSVILSGFRIFATSNDAQTFSKRKVIQDDDFYDAFKSTTGLDLPNFIPSLIKKRLATGVRTTGGKDNSFNEEVIVREYSRSLVPKLAETDKEKVTTLFTYIAQALLEDKRLTGWNDLKKEYTASYEAVDKAIIKFCGKNKIPEIAPMFKDANSKLPKNSTIAFDDGSVHLRNL